VQHYGGDWQVLFRSAVVYLVPLCRVFDPKPTQTLNPGTAWWLLTQPRRDGAPLHAAPLVRQFKLAAAHATGD
jgi:hypothetical protein